MIFQKNILKKYAATLPEEAVDAAWTQYRTYFLNADIQQNIRQSNEEQFQEGFLRELFVKVLGYALNPSPNYNLITEQKNETDTRCSRSRHGFSLRRAEAGGSRGSFR